METRTTRRRRTSSGLLAGALLLMPIAACGDTPEAEDVEATPGATVTESVPAEETGGGADVTEPEDTAGTTGPTDETGADVECSGNSCSVTLSGDGARAEVFGTPVVLGGVEDGRATFRAGDQDVSCGEGESVSAGPLTLACSTVTEDTVSMTASLG